MGRECESAGHEAVAHFQYCKPTPAKLSKAEHFVRVDDTGLFAAENAEKRNISGV